MKKKTLLTSILTIVMCLCLSVGGTFALFTSESKVDVSVSSGKVKVIANVDETSVQTKKLYDADYKQGANNTYEGVATFNEDGLTLEKFIPGDGIKFNIVVKNESNVTVKYRTIISCGSDNGLFSGLNVSISDNQGYNGVTLVSNWEQLSVGANDAIVPVTIELPETAGNDYQDKTCTISYKVEAVQGNAEVENPEDGTIYIYNANDLKALSGKYLVANNGVAETQNVELMANVDLNGATFKEIGVAYGDTLNFKGNGFSISNIKLITGGHNGMTNVGMFYVEEGATLNVENLKLVAPVVEDGVDEWTTGVAAVVGYANGAVNLTDVDVEGANVNNTFGNAAIYAGYVVNVVNLTDCDVKNSTASSEIEDGAMRTDKLGAYVGTANTASCVVTVNNCTNNTTLVPAGRVIYDAKFIMNGKLVVFTTSELLSAIKNAPAGETTEIYLAASEYAGNIDITVANLGKSGGDVKIKAYDDVKPVITGTVTLGYRNQGVGATMYDANVVFEGITFDHALAQSHSINVEDVKSLTLTRCTIIGDGEYGIDSARGNTTGASRIEYCTFENAGMQLRGNFATDLVIDKCDFNSSRVNIQAGNGVTISNCTFDDTLNSANLGDSFYLIRSNSTPITVTNCIFNIDSDLTEIAQNQEEWGILWNRGTTDWTVSEVEFNLTSAAQNQTELMIAKKTKTGLIYYVGADSSDMQFAYNEGFDIILSDDIVL